jgi:hypothetical protein
MFSAKPDTPARSIRRKTFEQSVRAANEVRLRGQYEKFVHGAATVFCGPFPAEVVMAPADTFW